jgi:hypothetical protein
MTDDDPRPPASDTTDWLALRLDGERAEPSAALAVPLRRRLVALGAPASRPAHLWRLAGLHGLIGVLLLAVGALSAAGIGPLGT